MAIAVTPIIALAWDEMLCLRLSISRSDIVWRGLIALGNKTWGDPGKRFGVRRERRRHGGQRDVATFQKARRSGAGQRPRSVLEELSDFGVRQNINVSERCAPAADDLAKGRMQARWGHKAVCLRRVVSHFERRRHDAEARCSNHR